MVIYHKLSKRKPSGSRYKSAEKKRLANMGSMPTLTKVGEKRVKTKKEMGGFIKHRLLSVKEINVFDPKTKKMQKVEITSVIESPSNRNFIRRNIITKGSILGTKLGKVRVNSRPGQEGSVSGVLI